MKKLLLFTLLCCGPLAMGQSLFFSPTKGCPGGNRDIYVTVPSPMNQNIAAGYKITVLLTVKTASNTVVNNYSEEITSGVAAYANLEVLLADVPLTDAMTYKISGSVNGGNGPSYDFTIPIAEADYVVAYPTDPVISYVFYSNNGFLANNSAYDEDVSILYYLNGDYGTIVEQTTAYNYHPTATGTYTAKNYNTSNGCYSVNVSNAVVVDALTLTAIELEKEMAISVYPNPVTSAITIESTNASVYTFELSDMNGQIVKNASFAGNGKIHVEDLKSGHYSLVVKNGNHNLATYKLVK